jgi:hypothetical protein
MRKRIVIVLISVLSLSIISFLLFSGVIPQSRLAKWKRFFNKGTLEWMTETKVEKTDNPYYTKKRELEILTPVFHIDTIYHSMVGISRGFPTQIDNEGGNHLIWFTDYSVDVTDKSGDKPMSMDFMCHNNLDFTIDEYLKHFNLSNRLGTTNQRFLTLTEGQTSIKFPEGFGIPLFSENNVTVHAQILNHNLYPVSVDVRHRIKLGYVRDQDLKSPFKPLYKQVLYINVPVAESSHLPGDPCIQECAPAPASSAAIRKAKDGKSYGPHWIIKTGRDTFRYDVTEMLHLTANTTMHFANVHLHPYAESLTLRDITSDSILFTSYVKNRRDKIGMDNIDVYSSEKGTMLFKDHQYELVCVSNNTSGVKQDMMAVMVVYMRDMELENNIEKMRQKGLLAENK